MSKNERELSSLRSDFSNHLKERRVKNKTLTQKAARIQPSCLRWASIFPEPLPRWLNTAMQSSGPEPELIRESLERNTRTFNKRATTSHCIGIIPLQNASPFLTIKHHHTNKHRKGEFGMTIILWVINVSVIYSIRNLFYGKTAGKGTHFTFL